MYGLLGQTFEVNDLRFFGSLKFYTLFIVLNYVFGETKTAQNIFLLLITSGIILLFIKMLISFLTEGESSLSFTTGLATIFWLFVIRSQPIRLFVGITAFLLVMVHIYKIFDDYTGSLLATLSDVFCGTIFGAIIYFNRREIISID